MAYANGYTYRKLVTQDHTKVSGGANLTSFPVLIRVTDVALKTVANGGKVQSSSGFDIRFESTGGTKLDHEVESWSASTGALLAWVRIPTLTFASDATFYLYYGNAAAVATEANPTAVWDASSGAVYHLGDGATLSTLDATGNTNTLTYSGSPTATAGQIDGAGSFVAASVQYGHANDNASLDATSGLTLGGWVKPTTNPSTATVLKKNGNYILRGESGLVHFYWWNNTTLDQLFTTAALTTGVWAHVVGVVSGNALSAIYVNGAAATTSSGSFGAAARDLTSALGLAASEAGGEHWDGLLDELRVATTARTAGWIATDYANQSNPSTFLSFGTEETSGSSATVLPGVGVLTVTGLAPTVNTPRVMRPGVGVLTLTGQSPTVRTPRVMLPGVGVLTLTGRAPVASVPRVMLPGVGALTLSGLLPTIRAGVGGKPGVGALTLTGLLPTIVATQPIYVEESATRVVEAAQALRSLLQAVPARTLGIAPAIRVLTPAMPLTVKASVPAVRTIQPAALLTTD